MANKGILGRKLGMTQVFDEGNRIVPVTVIEAGPCRVVQLKTPERDGYSAVQLAFGETKASRLSQGELGHLKAAGAPATRTLAELRVESLEGFEIGQIVKADVFEAGDIIDVTGMNDPRTVELSGSIAAVPEPAAGLIAASAVATGLVASNHLKRPPTRGDG